MDVRCDKCGTIYDFDEAQLTEAGVTVRCAECENVFRVRRRAVAFTEPVAARAPPLNDQPWQIRCGNGDHYSFKDLTTLQKWIVERKVSRSDEISRSGETWKRLGNIAELATFFQVVEQANASAQAGTQEAIPKVNAGVLAAVAPVQERVIAPAPVSVSVTTAPASLPPPPPAAAAVPASFGDEEGFYDDPNDDFAEFKSGGGLGKWFVVLFILVAGSAGAFYLVKPNQFRNLVGLGPDPAVVALIQSHLGSARAAIAKDTLAGFASAAAQLAKVEEFSEQAPPVEARALQSELHLAWALALGEEAVLSNLGEVPTPAPTPVGAKGARGAKGATDDTKIELPKDAQADHQAEVPVTPDAKAMATGLVPVFGPSALARLSKVKGSKPAQAIRDQLEAAFSAAREAMAGGGERGQALGAMVAYYGVMGDREKMTPLLDEALALPKMAKDARLSFAQGFALLGDEANVDSALRHLQSASETDLTLLRARLQLAWTYLAQGELAKAGPQLKKILAASPDHARAKQLLGRLETALHPPEPTPAPEPEPVPEPVLPKPKPKPLGFDGLLTKAYHLRDRGKVEPALDVYGKARDLKPGRAEPYSGQGLCYLEMRAFAAATSSFQEALKRNPRYGDALIGMAESLKYQGKKAKAKTYYQKYLDVLPRGPEAPVAHTFIESN